jgi:hydroxymethylpyrimidine/phosphomethylpyrimidine kinase
MHYTITLTIAGSDPSGGAGIQADIKTMSALGCYAAAVITSVTVQNTLGVEAVQAIRPDIVSGQIRAVLTDLHPRAIKIGMVNDRDTIHAIAAELHAYLDSNDRENNAARDYTPCSIIIDPVMVSTSGSRLMQSHALEIFKRELLPMADLLTPNIPEAEVLADMEITDKPSMDEAAQRILALGARAVLIKGGHIEGEKTDRLYGKRVQSYSTPPVNTRNTHGTGCTLSSAIACYLACGTQLPQAIGKAKKYVTHALRSGADVEIGSGHGPVDHFFNPHKLRKE